MALLSPQAKYINQPNNSDVKHDSLQAATKIEKRNKNVHHLDHQRGQQDKTRKLMIATLIVLAYCAIETIYN